MKRTKEEVKQHLMKEAEAAISRMLEEAAKPDNLTITDIEQLARQTGEQVMADITQTLVEAGGQQVGEQKCPQCGHKMRDKGVKGKHIISETGEVWVERHYYYCEKCRFGIFPPGSAAENG